MSLFRSHWLLAAALLLPTPAWAGDDPAPPDLESLLATRVVGAAKYEQPVAEAAAAVSVIGRDEIRAFGWRTLAQALASLPGVYLTYDRQYEVLGLRGFGLPGDFNSRVLLAVDGNRYNDPVYDGAPLGRELPLDLDLIERIEFIPGPGGAIYGQNAMFGVVNIVTRGGAGMDGGELALSYQHPQRSRQARASWGNRLDNGLDLLLSASAYKARGEDLFLDFGVGGPPGLARGMDGEQDADVFLRAGYGAWSLQLALGERRDDDPTAAYDADPLAIGQYERDRYLLAQLQYQRRLGDEGASLDARLFLGRQRYSGNFVYSGQDTFSIGYSDWHGLEARLLSAPGSPHRWLLGLEAQINSRVEQSNDDLSLPGLETLIRADGHRWGVYLQDEWRWSDALSGILGLRLDRERGGQGRFSPRAALIWRATPDLGVKALYGRAHRSPNSYERDFDDGGQSIVANPSLGGESMDTLELVADYRAAPGLDLRASLYQWRMEDLITLGVDAASGLAIYESGPEVRARGLEFSFSRVWEGGARLRGSLNAQDPRTAAPLINSPRRLARFNFSSPLPWRGLRLGYELRFDDRRLSLDGSWLPANWVSHLHLRAERVQPGLDLTLSVHNLLDRRYRHPGAETNWQNALEQDGRALRLGLEYRF